MQYLRVELIVDERADHLETLSQGCGVEGQAGGLEVQLQGAIASGPREAFLVIVLAAEQQGAHGRASFIVVGGL
ncbi:hypothetical protein D3C79_949630 [compost metagenome]